MKEWSNLPNAKHIDWVIQSVKDNHEEWASAYNAAYNAAWASAHDAALAAAYNAARGAAWAAERGAAWAAAWGAAYNAEYNAAWVAAWGASRDAARYAILALMAYDDIEHYFLSSHEELRLIYELSQHPAAILLLAAVKARELIEAKHEKVV